MVICMWIVSFKGDFSWLFILKKKTPCFWIMSTYVIKSKQSEWMNLKWTCVKLSN